MVVIDASAVINALKFEALFPYYYYGFKKKKKKKRCMVEKLAITLYGFV
jgi:hypothetical protein